MESWQIKPITIENIDQVIALEKDLFKNPWSRASYFQELACDGAYIYGIVSEHPGQLPQVMAYICFRIILNEMHLFKIGVAHKWQQRGLAAHLFRQSMKQAAARGAEAVYLEVRPSNKPAISLYRKLGFTEIGRRVRYYPETNEDALVMMKQFKTLHSRPSTPETISETP